MTKKSQNTMGIGTEQSPSNIGMSVSQEGNLNYSDERIEGTPFRVISDESGKMVVMGDYRLSAKMETMEELEAYMETWNFKTNVISAIIRINKIVEDKQAVNI